MTPGLKVSDFFSMMSSEIVLENSNTRYISRTHLFFYLLQTPQVDVSAF